MSFFGLFRKTPEQQAAEAEQPSVLTLALLRAKHARLLERATAAGLDPNTIALLIQFFGPLIIALVERLLARLLPPAA